MLFLRKVPFNAWLFGLLAVQYVLMHLFSLDIPASVTEIELVLFIVYTAAEIFMFIYRGRRTTGGAVDGMVPLFFLVLWTVSLFSMLQRESYPAALTAINSLGVFTAFFMLSVEYIFLIKD